ncbi:MAG: hypothetical protein ACREHE_02825 [Rhizomicrobium sp.]
MRIAILALIAALVASGGAAAQQDSSAPAGTSWAADQKLLADVESAAHASGILSVASHAQDMEQALAKAEFTYRDGDAVYILTDGAGEAMIASVVAGKAAGVKTVTTLDNPYPYIALYLGSYYDETGKYDDAVRVMDLGLAASAISGMSLGEGRPLLFTERGEALNQLRRFDDALANFNEALKIDNLATGIHAHLLRGRGYTYTELGRLDDAEADYKQSLLLEPGNAGAEHELGYIDGLRKGAMPTKGNLTPLQPPAGGAH